MSEEIAVKPFLDKIIGDRTLFSMENRAFNYVGAVSFVVILYCLGFDLYLGQSIMTVVLVTLFFVQAVLFYYSRFRMKYRAGVVVYAICCYATIVTNFYYNSGIKGPTLFLFFLIFHLLVTISSSALNKLWITLHIILATGIVASEYYHPEWVPDTYGNRFEHFMDVLTTYIAVIMLAFLLTNYLRRYYTREKHLADERAKAIQVQNEQITRQNIELATINEQKNKLFSVVSHDLKSPIDSISGYLEILSLNLVGPDERLEMETELLNHTKYTSELLINLLYWARTQMNGVNVDLKPLPLKEMIDDARNYKIAFAAKKGIKLTYSIDKDLEVMADTEMMRIVLRNIVNNAIKFTGSGGEICISVTERENTAEISISDTGVGIPADQRDKIFTLKTSSSYGTRDEKGIGLGLMLCKEFVDYMHGDIWFESEIGKGSVFHISLPLARR